MSDNPGRLTHLDDSGDARMVDVSAKESSSRVAVASAFVTMQRATAESIADGSVPKGDVLTTARIAGVMAAKKTADLIPLCHPLPLDQVTIDLQPQAEGIRVVATARTTAKTGVEMEALVGASIAALTIYDMLKGLDRSITVEYLRLESKSGGKSGQWRRDG